MSNAMETRPGYIDPMTWNNYLRQMLEQEISEASKEGDMEVMDDITGTLFAGLIGYHGDLPTNMGGWKGWENRLNGAVYIPGEGIFPRDSPDALEGLGYIVPNETYYPTDGPVTSFPGEKESSFDPNQWRNEEPFIDPDTGEFHDSTNAFQKFLPQIQGGFSGYEGYSFGGPEFGAEYFVPSEDIEIDLSDMGVTLGAYNLNSLNEYGIDDIGRFSLRKLRKGIKRGTRTVRKGIKRGTRTVRKGIKRGTRTAGRRIKKVGKSAIRISKRAGKVISRKTTRAFKSAYNAVKKAASWIANQKKKVKDAILSVTKKIKSTVTKYVKQMKSWIRAKALAIGALKRANLKGKILRTAYESAAKKKLEPKQAKLEKLKVIEKLRAIENSKVKVIKHGRKYSTKIAVQKPRMPKGDRQITGRKVVLQKGKPKRISRRVKRISSIGYTNKRISKAQALKMAKSRALSIKRKNDAIRKKNKIGLKRLISYQKKISSIGKTLDSIQRRLDPIIKKAESWKKMAINFLKNLPSAIKKIGVYVKKKAKSMFGIKGIGQVEAERRAFISLSGSDYSKVVGSSGIILSIVVSIIGGPILGGITFVLTVVIPALKSAQAGADKARAEADANMTVEPPDNEQPVPSPDELLKKICEEFECEEPEEEYEEPEEDYSEYEYEEPEEDYSEYEYEEPEEDYSEYEYEEEPEEDYSEYEYEEPEEDYSEYEYEEPEEDYSEYDDSGGDWEDDFSGFGDTWNFASDQDSDFQYSGMGYDIDTTKADTVVGTHTGLNPPRKSYRGSYKNVDNDNINYKSRSGNSVYTNASFQKMPTVAETRPFKRDIDYSSPTSNPGYADRMYSNGMGELGGSDEFDFSDVTSTFGDDFDVEFQASVLNQPDQFDINNSRSYGVIPMGKLSMIGAVSKSDARRKYIIAYKAILKKYKKTSNPKTKLIYKKQLDKLRKLIGTKKKKISSNVLESVMKSYYKAVSDRSKSAAEKYKAYTEAKKKELELREKMSSASGTGGGKWWQVFPTKAGGMFGGVIGGLGKVGNALFLIGSIGAAFWVGSKFVTLVTGSIRQTSSAIASLRTVPRAPQPWS